jgi:hypothetical protein
VTALILQDEHYAGKLIVRYLSAVTMVTDVEVLAKYAQQIAVGEKNSTGTMGPDQRLFFPKMRIVAGHPGGFSCLAGSRFSEKSINAAFSGAKNTGL